jgi:hypothetical protein
MNSEDFYILAADYFGRELTANGFKCDGSKTSTYYRWVTDDIVHVVRPFLSKNGTWYDIRVFATSPMIDFLFESRFPDSIGIPSDSFSYLHPSTGVGCDQKQYHCKSAESFVRSFEQTVAPALRQHAVPFLDRIATIGELVSTVRNPLFRAIGIWQKGDKELARPLLTAELKRLSEISDSTGQVAIGIRYLENLLTSHPM